MIVSLGRRLVGQETGQSTRFLSRQLADVQPSRLHVGQKCRPAPLSATY